MLWYQIVTLLILIIALQFRIHIWMLTNLKKIGRPSFPSAISYNLLWAETFMTKGIINRLHSSHNQILLFIKAQNQHTVLVQMKNRHFVLLCIKLTSLKLLNKPRSKKHFVMIYKLFHYSMSQTQIYKIHVFKCFYR